MSQELCPGLPGCRNVNRRSRHALVLLSLVVLAGCFGGGPGGTPTSSNPGSDPSIPPTFAPWTSNGVLSNVTALLDAHESGLLVDGFESEVRSDDSIARYVVSANRSGYTIEPLNGTTFAAWANATTAYIRQGDDQDPTYSQVPAEDISSDQLTQRGRLNALLTAGPYRVSGVTDCGERQCTVFRANESPREDIRNLSAEVQIDPSGVVRWFSANYTRVTDSGTHDVRYEFDVRQIQVTSVERPAWVADARNGTR